MKNIRILSRNGPQRMYGRDRDRHRQPFPDIAIAEVAIRVNEADYKQVTIVQDSSPKKHKHIPYLVNVPLGIYPRDSFIVNCGGKDFLIQCPDITIPGERIVVVLKH